jgi:RNA polymerase sigma-70 factor, ECF subfamily
VPTTEPHSAEQLIRQQYPALLMLFRQKVGNDPLADDLINQAVTTALEHLRAGRVSQPSLIGGYIFRVAMNHLRNHRRKASERLDQRASPEDIDGLKAESDAEDTESRILRQVRRVVEDLPTPRDREIVKRFYLDEQEKEHICSDLGLAPLHFDKVIFRARRRMKEQLEARGFKKSDFFGVFLCLCA